MANKQIFPQSIYPINGDVTSADGNPDVTVTGIQQTPVSTNKPTDGEVLVYSATLNEWIPADPIVSGPDPVGTKPSVNPVQVAGVDDGGLVREILTDTSGSIRELTVEQLLEQILYELRAIKNAVVSLDNTLMPDDFIASNFSNQEMASHE